MPISYRMGEKADSRKIAELIAIASDGVVEYLFQGLVPGMAPVEMVAHNLERDHYPHSYRSAVVASDGSDIVGMALSYPSSYHGITDGMRRFFPPDRLEHFDNFYAARVEGSWYLDALGVVAACRGQGIGKRLVELTMEKAKDNGCGTLSLIAFADNAPALSLYEHLGFYVVKAVRLDGNEHIRHHSGCLLLNCEINL